MAREMIFKDHPSLKGYRWADCTYEGRTVRGMGKSDTAARADVNRQIRSIKKLAK